MAKKILIIEDEISIAELEKDYLEISGFKVNICNDGIEGLKEALECDQDLIILDVMLPGIDGFEVLKKVRESGNNIPILMLSAKSDVDDRVEGLNSGANDYLPKPFDTRELIARIRCITRSKTETETKLTVGNISLDRNSFELSSPAGSFRLSNKEFQLMEYLMASPKRVIPTEWLLERIWGLDSEADVNIVWVYISYLRKKLKALNGDIQIKATRNVGYHLETVNDKTT